MASQGDRFRRRALSRGYKVDEVDAFLDRVEATLSGEPMGTPVPSQEVDDVVFRVRFGGYDEWQVDVYLDRVARQLGDLEERGVLGRAASPEFASGPPSREDGSRDAPMGGRDAPMGGAHGAPMGGAHGAPVGGAHGAPDGPMGGAHGAPMGGPPHGAPMGGRDTAMRDAPMGRDGQMPPPRDTPFGGREAPFPPRDAPMPPRDAPFPPRDGRDGGPMPPRDAPFPPRDGRDGGPMPPRDAPMGRDMPPIRGANEPTMMIKQPSPPKRDMPMHDEPSTPPPPSRRPEPPRGGRMDRGAPPPPVEDDGEGFGHLRADDGEGFGHLRGGDDDFEDPFGPRRGRKTPPGGFEPRDGDRNTPPGGFEPRDGDRNTPPGGFERRDGDRNTPPGGFERRDGDRFEPAPMGGGPMGEPEDRFGPPPPPPRFGPDNEPPRFGPTNEPPPPPPQRFGPDNEPSRFGPDNEPPRPPQRDGGFGGPLGGGMMPPPPPPPPVNDQWTDATAPTPGFGRGPDRFERGGYDDEMTRPLRRQVEEPEADSQLTQRLRRGGGDDRFAPPPPPPIGRGGQGRMEPSPPRRSSMMEPPVSPSTPPRGFAPGSPSTPPRGFAPNSPSTPPRGFAPDSDAPTMAHPVVAQPPSGRPPSPYDDPQGFRDSAPAGPPPMAPPMLPEPGGEPGRRNPYESRGVFDEPGRHGREEMTTELRVGDSPFTPQDLQRVEQLRGSFQPRRFGSGYDPSQVNRMFDAMAANMTGRTPVPISDKELDTSQFSLVQQGYFEAEVDAALREVRDIFAKRGMVR